ncbi:lysine N(6)-hydroxylase/L-ornithine N(5)-oxygenase family protein [Streptomyces sulphureus]|uniref:lysine N(6)-hydroxylase/L-ornithine N(5)-oxygenase family protein n=1 Tax=Streptomyces sulphureus TaxID=47758 RepID=UPI001FE1FAC9|nr:SidA/IucD/PvdA family monooxygenase [Streptomyces sulphureus]
MQANTDAPLSATDTPAPTQPTAPLPRTTTEPTSTRPPAPEAPEAPTKRPYRTETPPEPASPDNHRQITARSPFPQRPRYQAELTPSPPRRRDTGTGGEQVLDLACIGGGPFSLSLSALADSVPGLRTACFERERAFRWHPGLLIEGATLQVPFLADLVTLADPASPWSFLRFLRDRRRLFPFYFAERFHIERTEYDAYCRWVSDGLAERAAGSPGTGPHYGHHVDAVRWNPQRSLFEVDFTRLDAGGGTGSPGRAAARNVALGIGTEPYVPEALRPLAESASVPVVHSAEYLDHRERLLAAEHVTVVGSGQSGAEVFLDLLRRRPAGHEGLHWLTRSPAFAPMEYSKLGLEHFTPDYTRYFHALPEETRDSLLPKQWQLHKAVDAETLAAVHEELYRRTAGGSWPDVVLTPGVGVRTAGRLGTTHLELHLVHAEQQERGRLLTDAVVLATGYRERASDELLAALDPHLSRDSSGRPLVTADYRLRLDTSVAGSVYVQNGERHTHGVGAPDLGLAAHRSAVILNSLTGEEHFPLPPRTAFTSFGLREPDPGTPSTRAPGRLGDVRPIAAPSVG